MKNSIKNKSFIHLRKETKYLTKFLFAHVEYSIGVTSCLCIEIYKYLIKILT